MKRRNLDFHSADDAITEIQRLRESGYERAGNWNLTQICQQLTATLKGGMNGFGFRIPWILRATVSKWAFRHALKTRKLDSGYPTFKSLKPSQEDGADDDDVIDECIASIRRSADFAGLVHDHPLLNDISLEDWLQFMWIHAAHHLGFLIPKTD